jgi:hypothetical protein
LDREVQIHAPVAREESRGIALELRGDGLLLVDDGLGGLRAGCGRLTGRRDEEARHDILTDLGRLPSDDSCGRHER